jgi:hypothetical protein
MAGIQGLREDLNLSSKTHVVWLHSLQQTSAIPLVDETHVVWESHHRPRSKYW